MILEQQLAVGLPVDEAFARLRCFAQAYPHFHEAHRPHLGPQLPPLLGPGLAFRCAERLGLEERRYAFRVTRFEPPTRLFLEAEVLTRVAGLLTLRSQLHLAFRLQEVPGGCQIEVQQVIRWPGPAWLAPLFQLLSGGATRAHADEEIRQGITVLLDWPLPEEAWRWEPEALAAEGPLALPGLPEGPSAPLAGLSGQAGPH